MKKTGVAFLLTGVMILSGCTATGRATDTPSAVPVTPTPSAALTPTAAPTGTAATPTAAPSVTPTPTAIPATVTPATATPTVTPTDTPYPTPVPTLIPERVTTALRAIADVLLDGAKFYDTDYNYSDDKKVYITFDEYWSDCGGLIPDTFAVFDMDEDGVPEVIVGASFVHRRIWLPRLFAELSYKSSNGHCGLERLSGLG